MLIRNTIIYTLGRSASGVVNLVALSLYTRLLPPGEYGKYALVLVWVGVAHVLLFQWLHLGARRFLSAHSSNPDTFLSAVGAAYVRIVSAVILIAVVAFFVWRDPAVRVLLVLGTVLLCSQAWLELNLELSLAALKPVRYSTIALVRAVVGLSCGGALAFAGFGATGVLLGAVMGYLVPGLGIALRDWWRLRATSAPEPGIIVDVVQYGVPLTAALTLSFIVTYSDRLLLGWLRGSADVGTYAAAYDLTSQALFTLMMMVNLSAFPLAVRALEEKGVEAARSQLAAHAVLLLGAAGPATLGIALLAPNVSAVLVGSSYQVTAARLIPWLACGAFVAGIKAFYFDLSFQLGRKTTKQVWISMAAAALNIGLNVWWIPTFGVLGAAWASLVAFMIAAVLSMTLGLAVFRLPVPGIQWLKIAVATGIMGLALIPVITFRGFPALIGQIVWGASVYALVALMLNIGDSRRTLMRAFGR